MGGTFQKTARGDEGDEEEEVQNRGKEDSEDKEDEEEEVWERDINLDEVERALGSMRNGKAAGEDGIAAEFLKHLPGVWKREKEGENVLPIYCCFARGGGARGFIKQI